MPPDPARIQEVFAEVLATPHLADRDNVLNQLCGDQIELRKRVEALLAAHEAAHSFLPLPSDAAENESPGPMESVGQVIGPYTLIEQIGEGGFGVVFLAEQRQPIRRRVALKVLKPGMDTQQVIKRFEVERQALALMDHPNIAKVLDAGTTPAGRPYFVMELVKGIAVTNYCNQCSLTTTARLELFLDICQAVQHAHQKGVIHRDIKPSNVLVAIQDGVPTVKVIDFGVAKAINQRLTDESLHTGFAQLIGTPLYMSPEQAKMSPQEIDTRGDIYSLGVLLYELLTGTTPFDRERLLKAGFDEMRRIIREEEPPLPSARLSTLGAEVASTVANHQRTEPRRLVQSLRGDLDWIVMKCLEKDRTRRYETAAALAADIQHFLSNEPVSAVAPSAFYRFKKFARRNRVAVLATVAVASALLLGISVATWQAVVATRARGEAETAQARTMEALRSATDDVIEKLISSKTVLGPSELAYLESAIQRWQQFADYEGESVLARRMRAEGAFRIANLRSKLGQHDAAIENYQSSISLFEDLHQDVPADPAFLHDLATCQGNLAKLHAALFNHEAARNVHKEAEKNLLKLGGLNIDKRAYQIGLATHYHNKGNVLRNLGDSQNARIALERALEIWHELERSNSDAAFPREVAATHNDLGTVLADVGATDDARKAYQNALEIQSALLRESQEPERARELARTYGNRASLFQNQGQLQLAHADFGKSVELTRELVDNYPAVPDYRRELADDYNSLGAVLILLQRNEDAYANLEEGLKIYESLARDNPAAVDQIGQAGAFLNMGSLIRDRGDAKDSLEWFDKAVLSLESLHNQSTAARRFLRNSHAGRAHAYHLLGEFEEALSDWNRAVDRSPLAEQPMLRIMRAVSRAKAGAIEEAIDEITPFTLESTTNVAYLYNIACVYSIASATRPNKQQEYATCAIEYLRSAFKAGYQSVAGLKSDPDLAPLHNHEDFQKLLSEMESQSSPRPE